MEHTDARTDVRSTVRLLLGLVWATVPLWCTWEAIGLLVHLFGESATAAEEAEAVRWLTAAAVTAVGIPLVALLLGGRRAWVAALVVGCLVAGFTGRWASDLRPDAPPAPRPYVCQERSGGDSDCPGG